MKFTNKEKINSELAMRRLSAKAAKVYEESFPLDIYERENENGDCCYFMRGIIDRDEMTFEEVERVLEEL